MSRSWLYIAFGVSAALTILGAFAIIVAQGELASGKRTVTVTGEVVCLPHKKVWAGLFGGAETSECKAGLYSRDDGKYYGLGVPYDDKIAWLFQAEGSKDLFNVTGTLRPDPESRYDIAYSIEVIYASTADGSISIYQVYSRHFRELAAIVEEIHNKTGEGYSMGIDRGCDDIEGINGGGEESCILIALDKDVPELSSKIPKELEGYKVYVVKIG